MSKANDVLSQLHKICESSDLQDKITKLMDEVNSSSDFDGIKMSLDRGISNTPGPNNMAGKTTASFKFQLQYDASVDYTQKSQDFYKLTLDQVEKGYSHIFKEQGERKIYDAMKKVYKYFDDNFGDKLSWSYQRAFGDKKPNYVVQGFAQVLIG